MPVPFIRGAARFPTLARGRSWAHSGAVRAPCRRLIKFVGSMRKDVLAKLAEKIAACGVDDVGGAKGGAAMG